MTKPMTDAGRRLLEDNGPRVQTGEHDMARRILAIETEARALDVDAVAVAMVHVRGAHNPTADELDAADQEVRPCAWCRLAAEQAVEAIARVQRP